MAKSKKFQNLGKRNIRNLEQELRVIVKTKTVDPEVWDDYEDTVPIQRNHYDLID